MARHRPARRSWWTGWFCSPAVPRQPGSRRRTLNKPRRLASPEALRVGFPTAFYLFPLFIPMETLPYRSKDRHDPAAEPFVICLYRGDYACEAREDEAAGACDPGGVFYGTDSLCEPVFC